SVTSHLPPTPERLLSRRTAPSRASASSSRSILTSPGPCLELTVMSIHLASQLPPPSATTPRIMSCRSENSNPLTASVRGRRDHCPKFHNPQVLLNERHSTPHTSPRSQDL